MFIRVRRLTFVGYEHDDEPNGLIDLTLRKQTSSLTTLTSTVTCEEIAGS